MAGELFALLDDVAALARIAAASVDDVGAAAARASAKAGVVVDDTAVTPQYLAGSAAARELPIIKKIAIGSLRDKFFFILPAAVLLGQFLPSLLPVILIFGSLVLAYEGRAQGPRAGSPVTRPRRRRRSRPAASCPPSTRPAPI